MTETLLSPTQVFDGQSLLTGQVIRVEDGKVSDLRAAGDVPRDASVQAIDGTVSAGFVDLQVNGGGGTLLNAKPCADAIKTIAEAHRSFGTVGVLPTVISDSSEVLAQAVDAALEAKGATGVLGLHIEGPHISVIRRGTHDAAFLRPLDDVTLGHVRRLREHDIPVMITVAPEVVSPDEISTLTAMGAVVSLGHSDATAEQTRAGLAAGAKAGTHLFNAMSPMLNRAPGVVGALINSEAYCGLIVDGIHVAEEMIGLAIRARPRPDRMFLVSDAMPTIGGPEGFVLYGRQVRLEEGKLINNEGSLAGAHVTQAEGVARLVNNLQIDPALALQMATTIPAELMGFSALTGLVGRQLEDLICLDDKFVFTGFVADAL